ncbi:MAG: diguanylate cyclase [Campylobacterota bacterium]|nr:diguanylate cyclase [Campylobacterota bacterium]
MFLLFSTQNILLANTSDVVIVDRDMTKINLYKHIEILEDKTNKLTIQDIKNKKYDEGFKSTSLVGNSFGFSKSAFWVRFSLKIDEGILDALYLELEYPLMDYASLYIPKENGEFIVKNSGEFIPYSQKEINYRNHLFSIPNSSQGTQTYYMYVKSGASTQIPLNLYKSGTLIEQIDKENFILGGYYGNMILIMIATLLAFYKIRDKLFLTYGIYLLTYIFFQLSINGFFSQYFTPFPLEYSNKVIAISVSFVVLGAILFAGNYLQVWNGKYPKTKLLFYIVSAAAFTGLIITLVSDSSLGSQVSAVSGMILPLVILFGAISSVRSGYKPAKYFLAAWGIFLFGIFILGLLFLGFLPYIFVTAYAMQIGSTLELLLLSYALIYRINLVYQEKEEAKQKATEYLNQMNEGLESLVLERTKELNHKNELLSQLAIRDSMTNMLNHNASIEALSSMKSTALRNGYNLAVIMIDIDFFKSINDKYGHPAGDQVIIKIAEIINKNIRPSDTAGRYGGEEFIVILHNTNEIDAKELAERLRKNIESTKITAIENQSISASFGISVLNPLEPDLDIILQADKALYQAKSSGRNNIKNYSA